MQNRPSTTGVEESDLMVPAETRRALRVSATTLTRWARQGVIPFIALPSGHRRYRRADITAILAGSPPADHS